MPKQTTSPSDRIKMLVALKKRFQRDMKFILGELEAAGVLEEFNLYREKEQLISLVNGEIVKSLTRENVEVTATGKPADLCDGQRGHGYLN